MELKDKQKRIIELLSENEELVISKIAAMISSNLYQTEIYLVDMEEKNLVKSRKENSYTYWSLKKSDGKENNNNIA